ncbi:TPA: hypothetical protein ACK2XL_002528 [Klebsiella oxytoca]|uniref:hypothetical protein n=1 Tax=Klebsiella oxytoca TaxID=571 RepID=UPI00388D4751|nr:hypothetical protein [Klebsiella oxytoca]HCC6323696.1 hypothetical protein [Klebsiella oxytoca]
MKINDIFGSYISIKYQDSHSATMQNSFFEYRFYDEYNTLLFFKNSSYEAPILYWDCEVLPPDPCYSKHTGDTKSFLHDRFSKLNIYDDQIFNYIIFTLNSVTSIYKTDKYNYMNDFMKNYCFFQLSRLSSIKSLSCDEVKKTQDILFHYFLYTHPANEETVNSFRIKNNKIIHTPSDANLTEYIEEYHKYYILNYKKYAKNIAITPDEIQVMALLSQTIAHVIESGKSELSLPSSQYLDITLLNNIDAFISFYSDRQRFFTLLDSQLLNKGDCYFEYCFSLLLQNYVIYILARDFQEIDYLFSFFQQNKKKDSHNRLSLIINRIFSDAIFLNDIMRKRGTPLKEATFITNLFNDENRERYHV